MVDPSSEQDLAEAVWRVLSVPGLREELRSKGLERAKRFSWEQTARRTLEIYEEVFIQGKVK